MHHVEFLGDSPSKVTKYFCWPARETSCLLVDRACCFMDLYTLLFLWISVLSSRANRLTIKMYCWMSLCRCYSWLHAPPLFLVCSQFNFKLLINSLFIPPTDVSWLFLGVPALSMPITPALSLGQLEVKPTFTKANAPFNFTRLLKYIVLG